MNTENINGIVQVGLDQIENQSIETNIVDSMIQMLSINQNAAIHHVVSAPIGNNSYLNSFMSKYTQGEFSKRYSMENNAMINNKINGYETSEIIFDDIEMESYRLSANSGKNSATELSYENKFAISKYNAEESLKKYAKDTFKLSPNININKSTFNDTDANRKYHNKNGYDNKIETIVDKYFSKGVFKTKYLSKVIDIENVRLAKEIINRVIKYGFFNLYEKEMNIAVSKFNYAENSTDFIIELEHAFGKTIITFETNCPDTHLYESIEPKYKRISTYNIAIKTNISEIEPVFNHKRHVSDYNELEKQKIPESNLTESINRLSRPPEIIELSSTRAGFHNMEKLISFINNNTDFMKDLVRMYISNNDFETFLYMSKTKIEFMSSNGYDISEEINNATETICRLEELI